MRNSKTKLGNLLMIAMILIAILLLYIDKKSIQLSADELSTELITDFEKTNGKYLDKKLELSGEVKAYFSFENNSNLLELKTNNTIFKIFCSFSSPKYDSIASTLTNSSSVTIYGTFRGIKDKDAPGEIYIDADKISINIVQ